MPWREIPQDQQLAEGDEIRTHYCIQAPDIPFNDLLAHLSVSYGQLTGSINDELPGDCLEVEVIDRELSESSGIVVDGDECEFIYTIVHRVEDVPDDCDPGLQTASVVTTAAAVALSALVVAFAVTIVLHKTEEFFTGPAGDQANLLLLAGLVAAAGYAAGNVDDLLGQPAGGEDGDT